MNQETVHCPLCRHETARQDQGPGPLISWYVCDSCTTYLMDEIIASHFAHEPEAARQKLSALLRERKRKQLPKICLHMRECGESPKEVAGVPIVDVNELLVEWPTSVPDRLDRAFECLVLHCTEQNPLGRYIPIPMSDVWKVLCIALDESDGNGLFFWMVDRGWVERRDVPPGQETVSVSLTVNGWERYEELTKRGSNRGNPAFVAMWFGNPREETERNRKPEMDDLYESAIRPACLETGWRVLRSDSEPHNEPAMGQILAGIRRAPFLIANLTENNNGVYFEAGFAAGRGIPVIYTCPADGSRPHFDVSGINQLRYEDVAELKKRLKDWILFTQGEGPDFKKDGGA